MSSEGVALVARVALIAALILATAIVRTFVGPSKRRGRIMGVGTVAGIAAGVAAGSLASRWIDADVSVVSACLGIVAGWAIACAFARRFPRQAD